MIIFVNFELPAPSKKVLFLFLIFLDLEKNVNIEDLPSNHVESIGLIESFRNLASRPSGVDEGPSYDHFCEF